jgi:major membrane immunogen (membrane-anchored lipoprotein)
MGVKTGRTALGRTVAILFALAAIAGLVACGSDDDGTTGTAQEATTEERTAGDEAEATTQGDQAVETIVVRDGKPVGGVQQLEYDAGEQVRFAVRSDAADEVHVHGYDVTERLPAGQAVRISFPAEIEGIFEVELHGSEMQIAELRVNP